MSLTLNLTVIFERQKMIFSPQLFRSLQFLQDFRNSQSRKFAFLSKGIMQARSPSRQQRIKEQMRVQGQTEQK